MRDFILVGVLIRRVNFVLTKIRDYSINDV